MMTTRNIENITFESNHLCLLIDGKLVKIPLDKVSQKLKNATDDQKSYYTISPSRYGIHWPLIDEDLSVEMLLREADPAY